MTGHEPTIQAVRNLWLLLLVFYIPVAVLLAYVAPVVYVLGVLLVMYGESATTIRLRNYRQRRGGSLTLVGVLLACVTLLLIDASGSWELPQRTVDYLASGAFVLPVVISLVALRELRHASRVTR